MDNIIELQGEHGAETFEVLLRFRYQGKDYIALRPETEDEETAAVFEIHKLDDGEESYLTIMDDNLAKNVFVHFVSLWEMALEEDEEEEDE